MCNFGFFQELENTKLSVMKVKVLVLAMMVHFRTYHAE